MLITVVIFGKYLECAAKGKTSDAIKVVVVHCMCTREAGSAAVHSLQLCASNVHAVVAAC